MKKNYQRVTWFCFYLNLIKTLPAYKVSSEALRQSLASPVSNDGAVERCIEFPPYLCEPVFLYHCWG